MVAKNDEEESVKFPGIILSDKTEVKQFLKAIKRNETKKQLSKKTATYKVLRKELKNST